MTKTPTLDRITAQRLRALRTRLALAYPGVDAVFRRGTGWASLWDMLRREHASSYVPSCRFDLGADQALIADVFDAAMQALDDPRRAVRWYARGDDRARAA